MKIYGINDLKLITNKLPRFEDREQFMKFPNAWTRKFAECYQISKKWWWFTRLDFDSDTYYTWRHPYWWWMLKWSILSPIYRFGIDIGFWILKEGDHYTNGHADFAIRFDDRV